MLENRILNRNAVVTQILSDVKQEPIVEHLVHYRNMFANPDSFIRRKVDYSKMKVVNDKFRKESERYTSFNAFPIDMKNLIVGFVKSGFYYTDNGDQVKCIFCQGTIDKWRKFDKPMKRHKFSYPTCPFVINLNVANEPMVPDKNLRKPDYDYDIGKFDKNSTLNLEYSIVSRPLETLQTMEQMHHCNIDWRRDTFAEVYRLARWADDGLFVMKNGKDKYLVCCWCQKTVEILDDIETLDGKYFHEKHCQWKSEINDAVDTKLDLSNQFCKVEYAISAQDIEARTETSLVHLIIANKFTSSKKKDDIKSVFEKRLKETGKDFESLYEFLKALKQYSKERKYKSENKTTAIESVPLTDFPCVVCLDKVVEVIFLPCGHLKTCNSCSEVMVTCPVCRVLIVRRVKNMRFNELSLQ